jgi:hypothetical protein
LRPAVTSIIVVISLRKNQSVTDSQTTHDRAATIVQAAPLKNVWFLLTMYNTYTRHITNLLFHKQVVICWLKLVFLDTIDDPLLFDQWDAQLFRSLNLIAVVVIGAAD